MAFFKKIGAGLAMDPNFSRVGKGAVLLGRNFGSGSAQYLADRMPIFQWLPNYSPRWLISDMIAGQSVAMLLIPQALMFAQIAGMPMVDGLLAAWLPGIIYTFMGTSKDISVGPSLSISLVMAQTVAGIQKAAPQLPASFVAVVLSLGVGIWTLILGILNLGLIFDFMSIPVVLGFGSALGIVLINGQIPGLLGLQGISPVFIEQLPQIIRSITTIKPVSVGLSVVSLAILILLTFVGKKWGRKNEAIRLFCNSKNLLVLGSFTLISFIINKDLEIPLWSITGPTKVTIPPATLPIMALFNGLFLPTAGIAFGVALEHVLLAKVMGHQNNYRIRQSQELVVIGTTNIIQSFIGGLPVGGGDLARSAVLSEAGVKSPLAGLFTSATVLAAIFVGSPFLSYIPVPTLSAVIAVAAYETMPPMANMSKYFKISFLDFGTFLASFNFTMINGASTGVVLALLISIFSTLMRTMYSRPHQVSSSDIETQYLSESDNGWANANRIFVPPGTQILSVKAELMFLNAARVKKHILQNIFIHHSGKPASMAKDLNRPWNYVREKHISQLRRKAGRSDVDAYSPRIRILVLDFSNVPFIDTTGIEMLMTIKKEIRDYGGEDVDFRFVGLNSTVRTRFRRAGWVLEDFRDFNARVGAEDTDPKMMEVDIGKDGEAFKTGEIKEEVVKDLVFEILPTAVLYKDENRSSIGSNYAFQEGLMMDVQKQ